jgi:hypothetical protein
MTKDKALKLALEALEAMQSYASAERKGLRICDEAITAIKEALEQQEWVGLTQDELTMICESMKTWSSFTVTDVYFAIQEKLRKKNT